MRVVATLLATLLAACAFAPAAGRDPSGPRVVLAEGEDGDRTWRYLAYRTADGYCTAIELDGAQRAEGCVDGPARIPPDEIQLGQSAGTDQPTFVHGAAGADVMTVEIETRADGTFSAIPFPAPPGLGLPLRFFILPLPEASHVVSYAALDADGRRIGGAQLLTP